MTDTRRGTKGQACREEALLRSLLEDAGPRPSPPEHHLERIREAAHESWRQRLAAEGASGETTAGRGIWGRRWLALPALSSAALAASLLAVAAISLWWLYGGEDGVLKAPRIASVERVLGVARVLPATGTDGELALGDGVTVGSWIETSPEGQLALRTKEGASVRIDADTRARFAADNSIELDRGALYVDADPLAVAASLELHTRFGIAREIGTQFEVRLVEGMNEPAMRIRVREGQVELEAGTRVRVAEAGDELLVDAAGRIEAATVELVGESWDWALDSAPTFEIHGRRVDEYLYWLARETHWKIVIEGFDANEVEPMGGTYNPSLRPDQSFVDVLPSVGLEGELFGDVLTVRRGSSP